MSQIFFALMVHFYKHYAININTEGPKMQHHTIIQNRARIIIVKGRE